MRIAGFAMILLGVVGFGLSTYNIHIPYLRAISPNDLRLFSGALLALGAITYALTRGI